MKIGYDRTFEKKYAKLPQKVREQFKKRRDLFILDSHHPLLYNHALHEPYPGCRCISVTGDYRAIFYHVSDSIVRFINIGTHHELFGT
ncbi:MAG: Plasmid stabilization system [Candidatus Kaiserbacteria bacterium GW2011_GWA2_58_9]|uniref:Plasmid stabilization system n=1 Tax=Candidatus Kaiserbacteria bacterium GW2011_GWA2_58_9 TaxID=1618672 RepID=A0A0G1YX05_9BACT|nr:MAG: Plasmid stabilization system [Candidatus Kaiserbacteria bacterium GW2011_GWA2_58_9]